MGEGKGDVPQGNADQMLRWWVQKREHRTLSQAFIYSFVHSFIDQTLIEHLLCAMH